MKKIYKEGFKAIQKSKKRFFSILLIVLLGVGFFAGIKATSPDMEDTLNEYAKKNNFMDINLKSTWGITSEDIDKIKNHGYFIEEGYEIDAIVKDETEKVAHIFSYQENNTINNITVIEGRLPKEIDECVVEDNKAKIGDVLVIESEDLKQTKLKVVGLVSSPLYISNEKGSTKLLSGTIDYYMYTLEDNFKLDYYTDAYIKLNDNNHIFSSKYQEQVDNEIDKLEVITNQLASDRYQKTVNEVKEKIQNAKEEYNLKKSEMAPILDNPYVSASQKAEIQNKLDEALNEITAKEEEINDLEKPEWYVLDHDSNIGFYQYKQDCDRINNIAKLFPLVFFVVAVLICLTTMTRMVEEERVQLGTLKSLGYTNFQIVWKYLNYAFLATIIGSLIGVCIGFIVLPKVIFNMYQTIYHIGPIKLSFNTNYAILGTVIALLCTVIATLFTSYKALKEVPAQLMRPKSPKEGKKVFLERIPFIWKRLKFSNKVTVRNVFRYKKRFLMTIIGITGCTGLILAGFGLKDCITNMVPNQYEDIFRYQGKIIFDEELTQDKLMAISKELDNVLEVNDYVRTYEEVIDISNYDTKETIQLVVPIDDLDDYIILRNCKSKEKLDMVNGVVVTEKIAKLLDLKVNDEITIEATKKYPVKISGITENYLYHYIYMDKETYQNSAYNTILFKTDQMTKSEEQELAKKLKNIDGIASVSFVSSTRNLFDDAMQSFSFVSLVLIISAGLLASIVLYNLSTVNISERKRELATIKVLGFYDNEVYHYISHETSILTIIGILLGLGFGVILTNFVIRTCELDMMMFSTIISFKSYIYAILITLLFTFLVNITVYFSLKKIDMIDSLKSVE